MWTSATCARWKGLVTVARDIPLITEIRRLYRELLPSSPLSTGAQAVYVYLLYRLNEGRQIDVFGEWRTGIRVDCTKEEICKSLGVSPRSVQTWLQELTASGYVQYLPGDGRYESTFVIRARMPKIDGGDEFSTEFSTPSANEG